MRGVILYGAPAAGKDTITAALTSLDRRLRARGAVDVPRRLAVWEQTKPLGGADLTVDTSEHTPEEVAQMIVDRVNHAD